MTREIKFRAWDKEKEMMFNPSSVNWKSGTLWVCNVNGENRLEYELINPKAELMQFTGLLDKNGEEIYEGDIVKTKYQPKAQMIWEDEEACFAFLTIDDVVKDNKMYGFHDMEVEIIGNIYENPDLLTSSQGN